MELFINNLGNIIKQCSRNGLPTLCGEIFLMKKRQPQQKVSNICQHQITLHSPDFMRVTEPIEVCRMQDIKPKTLENSVFVC